MRGVSYARSHHVHMVRQAHHERDGEPLPFTLSEVEGRERAHGSSAMDSRLLCAVVIKLRPGGFQTFEYELALMVELVLCDLAGHIQANCPFLLHLDYPEITLCPCNPLRQPAVFLLTQ